MAEEDDAFALEYRVKHRDEPALELFEQRGQRRVGHLRHVDGSLQRVPRARTAAMAGRVARGGVRLGGGASTCHLLRAEQWRYTQRDRRAEPSDRADVAQLIRARAVCEHQTVRLARGQRMRTQEGARRARVVAQGGLGADLSGEVGSVGQRGGVDRIQRIVQVGALLARVLQTQRREIEFNDSEIETPDF